MLGLVACVALNVWLFRLGFLLGLVGLNITKHVGVAVLCQALGVNREKGRAISHEAATKAEGVSEPEASLDNLIGGGSE